MKFGRCGRCRHGISAMDGEIEYTICALMPPQPNVVSTPQHGGPNMDVTQWVRPPMANAGWCGQFKIGWLRLFGYGARA